MSLEDPDRDWLVKIHSLIREFRSDGSRVTPNLETLMSTTSESGEQPSFRDLTASLPELSVRSVPEKTYIKHLHKLYSIDSLTDIADIARRCQLLSTIAYFLPR
jgi:hypothetical protein